MGILYAILAALTWAIGDFSIERNSRKEGSLRTLLYISLFAALLFLPFAYKDLGSIWQGKALALLLLSAAVFLFSSIFDFLALKTGKISVVEPICAFEVPVTALLAFAILGERLTGYQSLLIAIMVVGIFLVSVTDFSHLKNIHAEKGAWFAVVATIGMGVANFTVAEAARVTTPFVVNWFAGVFIAVLLLIYFAATTGLRSSFRPLASNKLLTFSTVVADNLSWIFYTYAALTLPIAIAIALSESYIVLASILGFIYNKEKLRPHQVVGMVVCVIGVIFLSLTLRV